MAEFHDRKNEEKERKELTVKFYRQCRDSLPHFARKSLQIRDKDGSHVLLDFNEAQILIHEALEQQLRSTGKVRALIVKGRQQGACYSPEMRVLTSDYRWQEIKTIEVGQKLICIDEDYGQINLAGRRTERRIQECVVQAKAFLVKETFEVSTDIGTKLIVTGEHKHLCQQRGGDQASWRTVNDTRVGDFIRVAFHGPEEKPISFEDGWFGGLLDGEGSFGASPAIRISLSQVEGPVLSRAKKYLEDIKIHYYELIDTRESGDTSKFGNKNVHSLRIDRIPDVIRLLIRTRPSRFTHRALLIGKKLPVTCRDFKAWAKVTSIKPLGKNKVIDLQTNKKTYICEGLVSHNSTYVQARFFHHLIHGAGLKAYIITHLSESTKSLFGMTRRFLDNLPLYRPILGCCNVNELYFSDIDCGYKVGTAGSTGVGRGETLQLVHGSECGFWPNSEEHFAGIMQAVPNAPKTEIILESTANQTGNVFYRMCTQAMDKNSEWQLIFLPWYNQKEYASDPPSNFCRTKEEEDLKSSYALNDAQIYWRRKKIEELGDPRKFKQEYPSYLNEAFIVDTAKSFILGTDIDKASTDKNPIVADKTAPMIIGIDPAGKGKDASAYAVRCGRVLREVKEFAKTEDTMMLVGEIGLLINRYDPDRVFIDIGGLGAPIYDRLRERGYRVVHGINFGQRADDVERYANKRAEMYDGIKRWLNDPPCQIPDDDALRMELGLTEMGINSSGKLLLAPKKDLIKSPNLSDAFALTFASSVPSKVLLAHQAPMLNTPNNWNPYSNDLWNK